MILAEADVAQKAGARLKEISRLLGVSARTLERWRSRPEGDDRRQGPRRRPRNALTPAEEARVKAVLDAPEYRGQSPKQVVPRLADEGMYLASESTIYRLRRRWGSSEKAKSKAQRVVRATSVHRATGPNQVWSWDITYLKTLVRGRFLFLYLVMDVWSRRIMGWRIHSEETAEHAAELVIGICDEHQLDPKDLVLHSDNGGPMRGSTMLGTLQWLGIVPSFSRPHVSDDNPYSEALFRTLKYAPSYPREPFESVVAATAWVDDFVAWYNTQHRHSGIKFVTPDERHFGRHREVLARRLRIYQAARKRRPQRWSRGVRDWSPIEEVILNPERAAASPGVQGVEPPAVVGGQGLVGHQKRAAFGQPTDVPQRSEAP